MVPVELLRSERSHAMEVLILVPVFPTDGVRRAA